MLASQIGAEATAAGGVASRGFTGQRSYAGRHLRRVLKWLFALTIAESFIYKSVAEQLLGSTLLHYVLSALLCFLMGVAFITLRLWRRWPRDMFVGLMVAIMVCWTAVVSLVLPPVLENSLAAAFFGVLVLTFFIAVPVGAEVCHIRVWRAVYVASAVTVVASIVALVMDSAVAFDGEGGRFRGVLVSTAVASNVFFFGVLFSAVAVYQARSMGSAGLHLLMLGASAGCLVLTASRGAMAFAALGLIWVGFWKQAPLLLHRVLALATAVAMFAGVVVLTAAVEPTWRTDMLEFLRWEQFSTGDSRTENWLFGIERALQTPVMGEGLLSKYTAGGTDDFEGISATSYNQLYDPHSVVLYLLVVGGVPLLAAVLGLVVAVWIRAWRGIRSTAWLVRDRRALYMATVVLFGLMVVNGGSLVSFGNLVDRVWWVLLGDLYLRSRRVQAT